LPKPSTPILIFILGRFLSRAVSWLRHYATSWNVADSIPDEVISFPIDVILRHFIFSQNCKHHHSYILAVYYFTSPYFL
jgi:hypothetical protein